MNRKTRWIVTATAAVLLLSGVVAELSTGRLSGALDCLGKSPITRMVAAGNALAIVP